MRLLITKCQKGLSSMANDHFYAMCYGALIHKVFWGIKGYFLLSQTVEQSRQCTAQEIQFYFQL